MTHRKFTRIMTWMLSILLCFQIVPTASAANTDPEVPYGYWERIDDAAQDQRLSYTGGWVREAVAQDYKGTARYAAPGSEAVCTFTGYGVRVYCRVQGNTSDARIVVDGEATIVPTPDPVRYQACIFERTFKTKGEHTVRVSANSNYVVFDAFAVLVDSPSKYLTELVEKNRNRIPADYTKESWPPFRDALRAAQRVLKDYPEDVARVKAAADALKDAVDCLVGFRVTIDDADTSRIQYTGAWGTWGAAEFYAGTVHYSDVQANIPNLSYSFQFDGVGFEILQRSYSGSLPFKVEIDGAVAAEKVITANPDQDLYRHVVYSNKTLDNKNHTVKITGIAGEGNHQFQVDAVRTFASTDSGENIVVKSGLKAQMDLFDGLVKNHYEPAGWETAQKARDDAKTVYENTGADQTAVDAADDALYDGIRGLKRNVAGVEKLVESLGEITLDSENAVIAARKAYDGLTEEQKLQVKNRATLETAEHVLQELKKNAADAAGAVDDQIQALGIITVNSEADISAARKAYNALSASQKKYVKYLYVLEAAEAKLDTKAYVYYISGETTPRLFSKNEIALLENGFTVDFARMYDNYPEKLNGGRILVVGNPSVCYLDNVCEFDFNVSSERGSSYRLLFAPRAGDADSAEGIDVENTNGFLYINGSGWGNLPNLSGVTLKHGQDYHARVVTRGQETELYIDDVLATRYTLSGLEPGPFGWGIWGSYAARDAGKKLTVKNIQYYEHAARVTSANGEQKDYATLSEALTAAKAGDTVLLLQNLKENEVKVSNGVTLDLGGKTLETDSFNAFNGNYVMDSSSGSAGRLKVAADKILLDANNPQMPLYTPEGYRFARMLVQQTKAKFAEGSQDTFSVILKPLYLSKNESHRIFGNGAADNHLKFKVQLTWTDSSQAGHTQDFVITDGLIGSAYSAGKAIRLTVHGAEGLTNLSIRTYVESERGVKLFSNDGFAK